MGARADGPARLNATIEIPDRSKTFASGLLLDLVAALRRTRPGDLIALTSADESVGADLDAWSRLTGHATVASGIDGMQIGAADFLQKPVELDALCTAIRAAAERAGTANQGEPA